MTPPTHVLTKLRISYRQTPVGRKWVCSGGNTNPKAEHYSRLEHYLNQLNGGDWKAVEGRAV